MSLRALSDLDRPLIRPSRPPGFIPTADPNRRAGQHIDLLLGTNLYVPLGPLGVHRFAFEAGLPIYQSLDGSQLQSDWRIVLGWQKSFGPLF